MLTESVLRVQRAEPAVWPAGAHCHRDAEGPECPGWRQGPLASPEQVWVSAPRSSPHSASSSLSSLIGWDRGLQGKPQPQPWSPSPQQLRGLCPFAATVLGQRVRHSGWAEPVPVVVPGDSRSAALGPLRCDGVACPAKSAAWARGTGWSPGSWSGWRTQAQNPSSPMGVICVRLWKKPLRIRAWSKLEGYRPHKPLSPPCPQGT